VGNPRAPVSGALRIQLSKSSRDRVDAQAAASILGVLRAAYWAHWPGEARLERGGVFVRSTIDWVVGNHVRLSPAKSRGTQKLCRYLRAAGSGTFGFGCGRVLTSRAARSLTRRRTSDMVLPPVLVPESRTTVLGILRLSPVAGSPRITRRFRQNSADDQYGNDRPLEPTCISASVYTLRRFGAVVVPASS